MFTIDSLYDILKKVVVDMERLEDDMESLESVSIRELLDKIDELTDGVEDIKEDILASIELVEDIMEEEEEEEGEE